MTLSYVLMQNLRRNRVRTALTIASFALPMAVFVVAISLVALFVRTGMAAQREMRIAVRSNVSLPTLLPEGHRRKIEGLDPDRSRIRAVCGFRWFGGKVPGTDEAVQALGADADTFPIVFSDLGMTPAEVEAFKKERRSAVVGAKLAARYNWRVGERFTLNSNIPPYQPLEFVVAKLLTQPERSAAVYFHREYQEESLRSQPGSRAGCNVFWVKAADAATLQSVKGEIDALFANSPDETDSVDENAFFATFQQALGDIPGLMQTMAIVVVCIMGLVAGNTMMMSFRERGRELAVFKAMGFQSRRVFLIVLSESVMLAVIGSLVGIIPVAAWLYFNPLSVRMGPIGMIQFSPYAVVVALVIAVVVGILAGIVPAWSALRLRTTDALRRVA